MSEEAQARREKVLALRADGHTFREIGEQIGVSPSRAAQLHATALQHERRERERGRLVEPDAVNADTPCALLPVSGALRWALKSEGVASLGELLGRDRKDIARTWLRLPNVNRKMLNELLEWLEVLEPIGYPAREYRGRAKNWRGPWRASKGEAIEDAVNRRVALRDPRDGALFFRDGCRIETKVEY